MLFLTRLFRPLLLLAMLVTTALIGAGFLGALHPGFDTLSNFRFHLCVGLALLAVLWTFKCSRIPAFGFALVAFFGIATCVPGLPVSIVRATKSAGETTYRLIALNLRFDNPRQAEVLAMLEDSDADILSLSEYSQRWQEALTPLDALYPNRYHCPEWGRIGGTVILSRHALAQAQGDAAPGGPGEGFCGPYASAGLRDFEIGGKRVTIGSVHLRWPWPASGPRQIDALTPVLQQLGENALIAGDFNSVSWSHGVQRFASAGGLEVVGGIGGTWLLRQLPTGWARWFGLSLDNAMAKGAVTITAARTLEPIGSDHLPVLVEFVLR